MTFKRPFDNEISSEVLGDTNFKHQRLVEYSDCCSGLFLDQVAAMDGNQENYTLGDGITTEIEIDAGERPGKGRLAEFLKFSGEETSDVFSKSLSFSPWVTQSASEEEHTSVATMHLPSPEYFSFNHPARLFIHVEDSCNLLDYSPRKRVPIGPEHQAEIPDLLPSRRQYCQDGENIRRSGQCVIPFSESELCLDDGTEIGHGRSNCTCRDRGSFACVQHHIEEERQKLRSSLGSLGFSQLGFLDMGEVVAERWTKNDEHLFHVVIFSNPASFGKNFWKALSSVFRSRTRTEIVSYYFNVYMLQKRAEQNRVDPMNVDSDDDEWQGSGDDHEDNEYGLSRLTDKDMDELFCSSMTYYEDVYGVCDEQDIDPELILQENLATGADHIGRTSSKEGGVMDNQDNAYLNCSKSNFEFLSTRRMIEEFFGDGDFDWRSKKL